jgi:hypothetical protein
MASKLRDFNARRLATVCATTGLGCQTNDPDLIPYYLCNGSARCMVSAECMRD